MEKMSLYMYVAAAISLAGALVFYGWHAVALRVRSVASYAVAGRSGTQSMTQAAGPVAAPGRYATLLAANGL
ncbi:MAG: hypothetical protein HYX89_07710, partial [Chloroflexi bacterium]|nr:hypothetical protein [Chloroflexota bacterium]